jgi:5,10-methenyltetrahydrofolate synthetase
MKEWSEIHAWRKARRAELIARRTALATGVRSAATESVTRLLTDAFALSAGMVVGFCWPYKGELDARFAVRHWRQQGAAAALPEVVAPGSPLRFRRWWPGAPMKAAVMGIPVADGTEVVTPDVAIVPMVGWDAKGYRLGYGGGYFDATLAALSPRPVAVGLSYEAARLETIFPMAHDIAMDFVVTEAAIYEAGGNAVQPIAVERARDRMTNLLAARGLPRQHIVETSRGHSSPPCYAHEFPGLMGEDEPGS